MKRVRSSLNAEWNNFENDLPRVQKILNKLHPNVLLKMFGNSTHVELNNSFNTKYDSYDNAVDANDVQCSAWINGKMASIDEFCVHYGFDRGMVDSWKYVSHNGHPYYNILFRDKTITSIDFDAILSKVYNKIAKKQIKYNPIIAAKTSKDVARLIVADIHIGMDPDPNKRSGYNNEWDESTIMNRLDRIINWTLKHGSHCKHLIIDDLGDFLDGYNGRTTRGGHDMPQLMTTSNAFELGLEFRLKLLKQLSPYFEKITFNSIEDDNHGGELSRIMNKSMQKLVNHIFENVEYKPIESFMDHYFVGKHCIILSHGKDSEFMKFGMSVKSNPKNISKVDQYCKQNDIYKRAEHIHFCKGDSHQRLYDFVSSPDFNFMNYPAFSPPSMYAQLNYTTVDSGFSFQIISDDSAHPYIFDVDFK